MSFALDFAVRVLFRLLALLPLEILRTLGRALGSIAFALNTRPARTTRTNIELCYPELDESDRRAMELESLRHSGCTFTEFAALWHWSESRIQELIQEVEGESVVQEVLESKAVLGILLHWGNWEFTAYACGRRFGFTSLYSPRRLGSLDDRVQTARMRFGGRMESTTSQGLRRILQALQSRQVVLILPDQVPTRGKAVIAPFMGHDAQTTTLVQSLLARDDVVPIAITVERVQHGFHIRYESIPQDVGHKDPLIATKSLNELVAEKIKRAPAQYQWEYKRFRRLPNKDPYAKDA